MIPHLTSHEIVMSGRFRFRDPALLFAHVRLYEDRLELTGWRIKGRFHRRIPLQQVLQGDALNTDSLLLWLSNGETVRLRVRQSLRWKQAIGRQQRLLRGAS
jgi:hypothetical protein